MVVVDDGKITHKYVMPTITVKRNNKNKNEIDLTKLNDILISLKPEITHCYLEKVSSMPGQGVSSTFAFGKGFGILIGMLTAHNIPLELVPPQKWTATIHKAWKHTSLESKEKSKLAIKKFFPNDDLRGTERSTTIHHGLMDAALIALYGSLV